MKLSLAKKASIFVLISAIYLTSSVALDCSNVVTDGGSSGVMNYLANVTITVPVSTRPPVGWTIIFRFDKVFYSIAVWDGVMEQFPEDQWARLKNNDDNPELNINEEFFFRIRVHWLNRTEAPPVVNSLKFMDIELCK